MHSVSAGAQKLKPAVLAAVPLQQNVNAALEQLVGVELQKRKVPAALELVEVDEQQVEFTQLLERHCPDVPQASPIAPPDCDKAASGAIIDETIGKATIEANPIFLITSRLEKFEICLSISVLNSRSLSL